uniref:Uncharacterized protein n=1 Tax=Lepeophtheirus salmonis TaxID=72036 RepID=A0A0K2TXC1_LEPSM
MAVDLVHGENLLVREHFYCGSICLDPSMNFLALCSLLSFRVSFNTLQSPFLQSVLQQVAWGPCVRGQPPKSSFTALLIVLLSTSNLLERRFKDFGILWVSH